MQQIERPEWLEYFIILLDGLKLRGTCPRRQCSAIIIDKDNKILSTGYNGAPTGIKNCNEHPCGGQDDEKGDTRNCIAVHAEENAILNLRANGQFATTLICTNLPCFHCAKLICQIDSIKKVIYLEDYTDHRGLDLMIQKNLGIVNVKIEEKK